MAEEYALENVADLTSLAVIVRKLTGVMGKLTVPQMTKELESMWADQVGLKFSLNSAGTAYSVTGYTGTETDVYIPGEYRGKPVETIADQAFMNQGGGTNVMLTSIEIADGIKSIGYAVFEYQYTLASVKLPSTLESIGSYAFESCNMLTSIDIPESVSSIGEYAFASSGLTSITLSRFDDLALGENAFAHCGDMMLAYLNYGVGRTMHSVFEGSLMSMQARIYVAWGEDSDIFYADEYMGFTGLPEIYYDYQF